MRIVVDIEKVSGGYDIKVGDPKQPGVTMTLGHAVAVTPKQAAKRAGELIEQVLSEQALKEE